MLALALGDLETRVRLGASPATPAGTLSMLAQDGAVTVRAAVALNPAASADADTQLARDPDERVRMLLARKVLTLRPDLPEADQQRLSLQTVALLSKLVQDEAVRIRILIADILASVPGVPRDLILALAHDSAVPVSEPVLRLSPLLSDDDLLNLVENPPHEAASKAIAGRANLPAAVADKIVASADNEAVRALLANPSASIRETTLDTLIAQAHHQPDWHEPLVRRPALPPHAARALSEIVTSHWLEVLAQRTDLPPALTSEFKQRLWARLAGAHKADDAFADDAIMQAAQRMGSYGHLDEAAVLDAAYAGDSRRVAALLAVAARVPLAEVDRAATLRSPKALVSLVWKAGFSMRVAGPVQSLLGRLGPAGILTETASGFPLGIEEMSWQLELLARTGR